MKPCENQIDIFCGSQKLKITKPVRLIELFAGIGAQAKALENLNIPFEHYRVCEIDKYAVKSYNAIHNTNFQPTDITKLSSFDLGITDTDKYTYIMTYSFPCQDLSVAGKQRGMGKGSRTRSGLLWEVERLLTECKEKPQILLMENVPQVIGKKNIGNFAEWLKFLDGLGYKSKYKLLNAKNYGIPQNRNRCFMVSWLGDFYYEFPKPFELRLRLGDMLEEKVNEKYYLSKEQTKKLIKIIKRNWDLTKSPTLLQVGQLKGFASAGRVYSPLGLCPTIKTFQGGNAQPKIIDIYNKREINSDICGTITASGNSSPTAAGTFGIYRNSRIRRLTPFECWRLMGFGDEDFNKAKESGISDTQLYKQAGNSIVVPVLENIFKKMELI